MTHYHLIAKRLGTGVHDTSQVVIAYSLALRKFLFLEGEGHSLMGTEVSYDEALARWQNIFVELDAEWVLHFSDVHDESRFLEKLAMLGPIEVITY